MDDLKHLIRCIPDYPKPGIQFRDITTLLESRDGFRKTINELAKALQAGSFEKVAGIEARGFIIGGALSFALGAGFVALRKKGKLPATAVGLDYALEYGTDRLEMHVGAVAPGERVLVVDDLVATGGTALAAVQLLREEGAIVDCAAFVIDLPDLGGAQRLADLGIKVVGLVRFEGH